MMHGRTLLITSIHKGSEIIEKMTNIRRELKRIFVKNLPLNGYFVIAVQLYTSRILAQSPITSPLLTVEQFRGWKDL